MKKTSMQEISELIRVKDGNELERAAAIAVVSAVLASRQAQQKVANSSWASESGLREGLEPSWQGRLRS